MANYTDITVLLDRSGSMEKIKKAMEGGFQEFVNQHKAVPTSRLSLVQFDTQNPQEAVYTARPITDAPHLELVPRGGTPLLDALCTAIDNTGKRLAAMAENDRPNKVLFVIITDGEENASVQFKRADVKARVEQQTGAYKWQFVYLGANQNAFAEAASFGISLGSTANYTASAMGTNNIMRSMATNTLCYASGVSSTVVDFNAEQREDAMEDDKVLSSTGT